MKISTASKKVLASALSAAMVVAFAPTVAFAAATGTGVKVTVENYTDSDAVADGYVAKKSSATGVYYYDIDELKAALVSSTYSLGQFTIMTDINEQLTITAATGGVTLNLNGHTVSNSAESFIAKGTAPAYNDNPTITISGANKVTIKNGTVKAVKTKNSLADADDTAKANASVYVADSTTVATNVVLEGVTAGGIDTDADKTTDATKVTALTVNGGTYGAIEAATLLVKGEVKTAAIDAVTTTYEGATLTAEAKATKTGQDGDAIAGGLVVGKNSTVTATATSSDDNIGAVAISGNLTATAEGAKVVATAKSTGEADAFAVKAAGGTVAGKDITASADSAAGSAYAVVAGGSVAGSTTGATISGGTYVANGSTAAKSYALDAGTALISGGSFDGKLALTDAYNATYNNITAGTFTANPTDWVNTANYDVAFSGGTYTVSQFKGFDLKPATGSTVANNTAMQNYLQAALEELAKGNAVSSLAYTEGWDAAKLLDKAKNPGADGKVGITLKVKQYNAKTATDAQKAAKEAIEKGAKEDLAKTAEKDFYTVTCYVGFVAKGAVEDTVIANVTELGKIASGLSAVDNNLKLDLGALINPAGAGGAGSCKGFTAWAATSTASKVAFTDEDNDGKADDTPGYIKINAIPAVIGMSQADMEAIKDAAEKGEQAAETITDPAVLAAIVQLQDQNAVLQVEGKSKTVKKGKSATIKLGVAASASGAKVTFKKANTAGKKNITVSKAGTVSVKKALKKGTYNVKVKATCGASFKNVLVKIVKK